MNGSDTLPGPVGRLCVTSAEIRSSPKCGKSQNLVLARMAEESNSVRWSPPGKDLESPRQSPDSWQASISQGFFQKTLVTMNGQDSKAIYALKVRCQTICSNLREIINDSHKSAMSVSTASCSSAGNFTSRCTVCPFTEMRKVF